MALPINSDNLVSTQDLASQAADQNAPKYGDNSPEPSSRISQLSENIGNGEEEEIGEDIPQQQEEDNKSEVEDLGDSGLPKEIEDALISCYDYYRLEERGTRDVMIAFWKKLENYWQGIQRIFWDYSLQDWKRVPIDEEEEMISSIVDPTLYDKIINIYRAHGESIIAALSVKTPNVIFYPDDADTTEDVDTAKAYDKIAQLICRHNKDKLLIVKSLFILFNQGLVASYIYNRESSEYGMVQIPQYGDDINYFTHTLICPACQEFVDEFVTKGSPEYEPREYQCSACGATTEPEDVVTQEVIPQVTGYNAQAKSRTILDIFGPLYVHTAFYARKQQDIPYVHFNFEQHNAMLRDFYPDIKDKLPLRGGNVSWDKWARSFNNSSFSDTVDLSTVTLQWLRPWAFECLGDDALIGKLKARFPDGCYSCIINGKMVADGRPENLDAHWEFSENPISNFLHADPLGKVLAPVQEIQTEINDLKLETFEHSIPETYANPKVLDFNKYKRMRARPGMMVPAKPPQGGSLADGFHTVKPATLSDEIAKYDADMTGKGQFVTGAFPSIFGGANSSGSKTAQEYTESRAMALQRLSLTWNMLKPWWANSIGKAVTLYANSIIVDEKFVTKNKTTASFENIWIKTAELTGNVGSIEPDVDEELPISNEQIKSTIMELFTLNNPDLMPALLHPNNTPLIARALGSPDFYVPGKEQRDKQFAEINKMLKGFPIDINPILDDDEVHIQVLKSWMVDTQGRAIEETQPEIFGLLNQHLMMHQQNLQATAVPTDESGKEKNTDTGGKEGNDNAPQ